MMICVKCLIDLTVKENGVLVARDKYHVQRADLMMCPECGLEILCRAGQPARVELANEYYNRTKGTHQRLYQLDTKTIFPSESIKVV